MPGNDWALIQIDPAVAARWGVSPAVPVAGGPNGIYTSCSVTPVVHYGHGYGVAVRAGQARGRPGHQLEQPGLRLDRLRRPGDSGSPVLTAGGQAAGDFTHLIVDPGTYPGSTLAGTRITHGPLAVRRLARERERLAHGRGGRRLLT